MNTKITYVGLAAILTTLVGCKSNDASQRSMAIPNFQNTGLAKLEVESCTSGNKGLGSETTATIIQSVVSSSLNWFAELARSKLNDDINNTILTFNLEDPSQLNGKCLRVSRYINSDPEGQADLLFSAQIVASEKHPKYITFVPTELEYAGYTPNDLKKRKTRDVAVALGVATPDTTIDYGNRDKTQTIGRLINLGTITQPKAPDEYYASQFSENSLGQGTQWMEVNTNTPVTLVVQVIESTKPNQIVKLLAQTVVNNEDTFKDALLELEAFKSDEALQQAKLTKIQEANTALLAYYTSLDEVALAKNAIDEACKSLSDEDQAKPNSEIKKLQRKYDLELRESDLESRKAGITHNEPTSSPIDGICKS
jgi:hypothetical protein